MKPLSRTTRRTILSAVALGVLCLSTGCTTPKRAPIWPRLDALPKAPPADLSTKAPATTLRRGSDGLLYMVAAGPQAKPGARFLARYSGDWPMKQLPRPPLVSGQVVRRYRGDVALVELTYRLPDTKPEGLRVEWKGDPDDLSKGVAKVVQVKPDNRTDATLSLGKEQGVRPGDIYALVTPGAVDRQANGLQLGRRLIGACLVHTVQENRALCKLWRGSGLHPEMSKPAVGQLALFMEHTFGQPPRQASIQFARIEHDQGDRLRDLLVTQMNNYLTTHAAANARAEPLNTTLDATTPTFHRAERAVTRTGKPQLVVAASIKRKNDVAHLILNYTTASNATGPGMIAAPPTGGMDLGPVEDLDGKTLRRIFGVIWGTTLVVRGQTSEALVHLRQLLLDRDLQGPMRWHTRDQYAMRWAALGRIDEALWLVMEDEAIAKKDNDQEAYLNALGTRVRLLDMVEQHKSAVAASQTYLDTRRTRKEPTALLSALGMHAEMLLSDGREAEARRIIDEMTRQCPDGCKGDLFGFLSGVYWSTSPKDTKTQDLLFQKLDQLARKDAERLMPTLRIYQGLQELRAKRPEAALIAFLDSQRLFARVKSPESEFRARYFAFLARLSMDNPIRALKDAGALLRLAKELRDYGSASRIYNNMISLYSKLPGNKNTAFTRSAVQLSFQIYGNQVASDDLRRASETLFVIGRLLLQSGDLKSARTIFQRVVVRSIQSARFELTATAHLMLSVIARARNDRAEFVRELKRAQVMAKISGDPAVKAMIRRVLEGPKETPPDVKTRLL